MLNENECTAQNSKKRRISFSFHSFDLQKQKKELELPSDMLLNWAQCECELCEAWGICNCIHILCALNCFMKYDFVSQARVQKIEVNLVFCKGLWITIDLISIYLYHIFAYIFFKVYVLTNKVHTDQCLFHTMQCHSVYWKCIILNELNWFF